MAFDPEHQLRPITIEELPRLAAMVESVFLSDPREDELEIERKVFEPPRSIAVFDGDEPVASAAAYTRDMTVPGGPIPVAGVTWVAVSPTHRRRGLLTRMMRHQLGEMHHEGGEAVAVLWASEAAIYGRFGYGLASRGARLRVSTAETRLRPDVDRGSGQLRQCSAEDALPALKSVYERVRVGRVGHLDRRGAWWMRRLFDPERWREGASALRFLVHSEEHGEPDGYAVFSVKASWGTFSPSGRATVRDIAAATPSAYAAVWGFLLELDLVREVLCDRAAIDEPLLHIVHNSRAVQQEVSDALWVRIVDVDRALSARRYSAPTDIVLDISDEFCPWNAGRYRLTGDVGAAVCVRTDDPADLALSSTTLGAAYLGGTTLTTLAAAGLVRELRAGALEPAAIAFATTRQPSCPEVF